MRHDSQYPLRQAHYVSHSTDFANRAKAMTKKSVNEGSAGFSRRQFLEAIGAAGALGMLGTGTSLLSFGAAAAEAKSGEVLTGSHWGAFRAKVQGGRVVGYTPWEKDLFPTAQ